MTVSERYTLLPLDSWAAILGISPWEFAGFTYPAPKSAQCKSVFQKFQWQSDHLSTSEVADAIADAEAMLAAELMYHVAPTYTQDEPVPYPRNYNRQVFGFAGDIRGDWKSVGLKNHKVISGGVLNRTAIATIGGADLTATDLDGDGVKETFTAVITNAAIGALTDPYELALYFAASNRHGEPLDETWRIRPLNISITGNTATITGHRTLLANPTIQYAVNAAPLDATLDANYVSSVECYSTFTDTTATDALPYQGVAMWKNNPDCSEGCTFSITPICLGQHQNEQGQVFASFGEPCSWPFPTREPDRLQVNYLSGVPLVNGKMDKLFAQMVAYLSVSLLANEACGCQRTNRILARLRQPTLKFQDNTADAQSFEESTNAFPQTYGGQFAWKRVQALRHIEIVSI